MLPRLRIASITLLTAVGLFLVSAVPAWAAQSITLTWVRHAQSLANAAGYISSTVPGPVLTPLGEQQAAAVAQTLAATAHDGVYVSDMIRTSLTAAPYVALSGIDPVVLGGVREITAGYLEGQTNTGADSLAFEVAGLLYSIPVAAWSLGLRALPVIFGETGNNFNARTTDAINTVYASGDLNPVVFAHGATIQAWTLMNVSNPVITGPLENTGIVVVNGNPEDGWTLQSWNGEEVSPTPNLLTKLFLDFRELIVTPQRSIYNIVQSLPYDSWFADGTSLATVAAAVWDGVVAIVTAPITFVTSVVRDIGQAIFPPAAPATSPAPSPVRTQRPDTAGATPAPAAAPESEAAAVRAELTATATPRSAAKSSATALRNNRAARPAREDAPARAASRTATDSAASAGASDVRGAATRRVGRASDRAA